jgi:hypothetical protein
LFPRSPDTSEAYLGRWIVLPFPTKFEESASERERIEALFSDTGEMQGLFRLAVEGLDASMVSRRVLGSRGGGGRSSGRGRV